MDGRKRVLLKILIGVGVGALLGFLYYRFVGCATGACLITRNPYISTLYGALIGALVASGAR